jgi:hypothetical protein
LLAGHIIAPAYASCFSGLPCRATVSCWFNLAIERDFHNVIVGIVGDADERQSFRLYLIAQIERCYLDFRHPGLQEF